MSGCVRLYVVCGCELYQVKNEPVGIANAKSLHDCYTARDLFGHFGP
jgi:hypothetical protein